MVSAGCLYHQGYGFESRPEYKTKTNLKVKYGMVIDSTTPGSGMV